MSFLLCAPSVCVINDEYEILLNAKKKGIFSIQIGEERYYPQNSGVLSSEKKYAKIRVKQDVLDRAGRYEVLFRSTINRKAYFSEMGEQEKEGYVFKPILKTEDIKILHIADVHYAFSTAEKVAGYYGDDTDLYIFNGDIGEVETDKHYTDTLKFIGRITRGEKPVIFARGNHDTRGKLAEKFTEYYPANGEDTFYTFSVGNLFGIILDCGEDKLDDYIPASGRLNEYNGVNRFHSYREKQLAWLKTLSKQEGKTTFAISHICPVMTTVNEGDIFDIERDIYQEWNAELERLGVRFMLCGHLHRAFILSPEDERNILAHNYPVIVGSDIRGIFTKGNKYFAAQFIGAALKVEKQRVEVDFVDQHLNVLEKHTLQLG